MLEIKNTNKFQKDLARMKKRGKDMGKFKEIAENLVQQKALSRKCQDHSLIGNYVNRRECYIEPDWLLIYNLESVLIDELETDYIIFERTGTHSDLF